jgi:hypothetical protein
MKDDWKRWLLRYTVELVVIFTGITASFVFDEWRKAHEERALEIKILRSLDRDLTAKANELSGDAMGLREEAKIADSLLNNLNVVSGEFLREFVFGQASITWFFDNQTPTYSTAISNNLFSLVQSDTLRTAVVSLHYFSFNNARYNYEALESVKVAEIRPMLSELMPTGREEYTATWHSRVRSKLASRGGQRILRRYSIVSKRLATQNISTAQKIESTQTLIRDYLRQNAK